MLLLYFWEAMLPLNHRFWIGDGKCCNFVNITKAAQLFCVSLLVGCDMCIAHRTSGLKLTCHPFFFIQISNFNGVYIKMKHFVMRKWYRTVQMCYTYIMSSQQIWVAISMTLSPHNISSGLCATPPVQIVFIPSSVDHRLSSQQMVCSSCGLYALSPQHTRPRVGYT